MFTNKYYTTTTRNNEQQQARYSYHWCYWQHWIRCRAPPDPICSKGVHSSCCFPRWGQIEAIVWQRNQIGAYSNGLQRQELRSCCTKGKSTQDPQSTLTNWNFARMLNAFGLLLRDPKRTWSAVIVCNGSTSLSMKPSKSDQSSWSSSDLHTALIATLPFLERNSELARRRLSKAAFPIASLDLVRCWYEKLSAL